MQTAADPPSRDALLSLLSFWTDAGVGALYEDQPVDRLAEGRRRLEAPARPAAPAPVARSAQATAPPSFGEAVGQAKASAAAATNLAELEAAIADFEGCALKRSGARRAVFARGNPEAPVVIVGEGPGGEEDERGQPFVGPAGRLLDRMLEAAGLSGQVFITNTVFWRPPGNRAPSPEEQAVCAPFLERAIALVQPRLLLLAGGASAKAMLQSQEGILTLRGRWREWTPTDGGPAIQAMPTLHPAFLLRQPAAKKKAWADLLTLAAALDEMRGLP